MLFIVLQCKNLIVDVGDMMSVQVIVEGSMNSSNPYFSSSWRRDFAVSVLLVNNHNTIFKYYLCCFHFSHQIMMHDCHFYTFSWENMMFLFRWNYCIMECPITRPLHLYLRYLSLSFCSFYPDDVFLNFIYHWQHMSCVKGVSFRIWVYTSLMDYGW